MSVFETASVSVIIVNWNGGALLSRCLSCVAAQQVLPERIVVIDNGSTDGSIAAARQMAEEDGRLAPRILFDLAGENLGFAAANNRGVALCDTDFIALLNADAFPEPGWLAALLDSAHEHPAVAAFGSRQVMDGSPDLLDGVGDVYHVSGLSWREGHGCRPTAADGEDREIFSPCAAAALYRRAAFIEVGGFDEDFFCYFEDVDLGFRLRLVGHQARYVSKAIVSHVGAASSPGKRSDFAVFYGHRNLVWCYVKNMPGPILYPCLIAHLLQTIFVSAFLVTRGQALTVVKSKWQAVTGLPTFWRKRRLVQASKRISAWAVWRVLDKSIFRRQFRRGGAL